MSIEDIRKLHRQIASLANQTHKCDVLTRVDDDDCAVIQPASQIMVITTDFINSSPAIIELGNGSWYELGQLVVCHNLADLAGSGCFARFFMSGICVPRDATNEDVLSFTRGVCDICAKYNCSLIGGDTKVGRTRAIYGTAIGSPMAVTGPFLRTNAQPGYKIGVSGCLGSFAAAVVCLHIGTKLFSPSEIGRANEILLNTEVPFEVARHVASSGYPCTGTDISDGLGTDLLDICKSSSVTAIIDEAAIPVDKFAQVVASRLNIPAWSFAFTCGGDFACIFGLPAQSINTDVESGLHIIGEFQQGLPILWSNMLDCPLDPIGHSASRTKVFADEILTNARIIEALYGTRTL